MCLLFVQVSVQQTILPFVCKQGPSSDDCTLLIVSVFMNISAVYPRELNEGYNASDVME